MVYVMKRYDGTSWVPAVKRYWNGSKWVGVDGASDVLVPTVTGGTVTESGGYTYHTFEQADSGTDLVVADAPRDSVDILVVAGGGGGNAGLSGTRYSCAGGGGEVVELFDLTLDVGSYTMTVGAGGAGCTSSGCTAADGGVSSAAGITGASATGGEGAPSKFSGASGNGNPPGDPNGTAAGGGGGNGGAGQNAPTSSDGGDGGPGTTVFDGLAYGGGGAGQGSSTTGSPGTPRSNGRGTGGQVQGAGFHGRIIVRYPS